MHHKSPAKSFRRCTTTKEGGLNNVGSYDFSKSIFKLVEPTAVEEHSQRCCSCNFIASCSFEVKFRSLGAPNGPGLVCCWIEYAQRTNDPERATEAPSRGNIDLVVSQISVNWKKVSNDDTDGLLKS